MYGTMLGVEGNIKKQLLKWMDWEVSIKVFHTIKNILNSIKLNQETVEISYAVRF